MYLNLVCGVWLAASVAAGAAYAQDSLEDRFKSCADIGGAAARLLCYDQIARERGLLKEAHQLKKIGDWLVDVGEFKIDGSPMVTIAVQSVETVGNAKATFAFRCFQGQTQAFWDLLGIFFNRVNTVRLSVDGASPFSVQVEPSANLRGLGYWESPKAQKLVLMLVTRERLVIEAQRADGGLAVYEFPIRGLQQAIAPVRKACKW